MVYLILIIILFVLYFDNKSLKKEIQNLREIISKQKNFCPKCGHNLNDAFISSPNISPTVFSESAFTNNQIHSDTEKMPVTQKNKLSSQEFKNSLILITGAVLIIIAAISFLISTWYTSANYLKTFILIIMFLVFGGSSFIAQKYLKLNQTSKVFFYIAMSYIPIIFLSIGLFGLLGDYLSFNGEGRYIYLLFSCLLISFIYILTMQKKNSVFISILGIYFEILSVIFFVLIFTNKLSIILFGLVIYSIALNLLYLNKQYYFNIDIHKKVSTIITFAISTVSILFRFNENILTPEIYPVLLHLFMIYNLYILFIKINKEEDLFNIVYPILLYFVSIEFSLFLNKGFFVTQLCIIATSIIIYFIDYIRSKKTVVSGYIISSIAYLITYLISLFKGENIIFSYLFILIYLLYSFINYIYSDKSKEIISYLISISLCGLFMDFVLSNNLSLLILPVIYSSVVLGSKYYLSNDFVIKNPIFIVGNIFLNISTIFALADNEINLYALAFISIISSLVYLILAISNKKYKYIFYLYVNIASFTLFNALNIQNIYVYAFPIALILNILFNTLLLNEDDDYSLIFLTIEYIFSSIYLFSLNSYLLLVIHIISTLLYYYYLKKQNCDKYMYYIPYVGLSMVLYLNSNLYINELNAMSIFSILFIAILSYLACKNKDFDQLTIMSFIAVMLHVIILSNNKYFGVSLSIIYFVLLYLVKKKDLFKAAIYISITILLEFIITDLGLSNITVMLMTPYMILMLLITRTILFKFVSSYKVFEYLGSTLINLIAMFNYADQTDGMVYLILLLVLIIFGYIAKVGPVLLTSLAFIILNVLLLTKEFWISLPWWIYLLFIGAVLIIFAMRNEISNKKASGLLEDIKDKFDL